MVEDDEDTSRCQSNSYLELREQKISRNLSRLRDLGLIQKSSVNHAATALVADQPTNVPVRSSKVSIAKISTPQTRRRSPRLRSNNLESADSGSNSKAAVTPLPEEDPRPPIPAKVVRSQPVVLETRSFANNSARSIPLDVDQVVENFLGVRMKATGKAHVMNECGLLSSNCPNVSFNKYSGVQEWGNNVFFLWVNLDAPQATVVNEFSNGTIAWFGGSRMHHETPVITRLRCSRNGKVVLWCRKHYGRIGFGPYVCLGRLSLSSYDPSCHPIMFTWKLLDYDRLVASNASKLLLEDFRFTEASR